VDTSTPLAARDHARAQAGARAETMRVVPVSEAVDLPQGVVSDDLFWDERLGPGGYATHVIARGSRLRLVDLAGDTCASVLLYAAAQPVERYNAADTVKVQWNAYLGAGRLLLSDMGRTLASVVVDEGGHHDLLCGASPAARARLVLGLAKHGLGRGDLMPSLNLFTAVRVDVEGALEAIVPSSRPGAVVELRADMDVLVVVAVGRHVLDDRPEAPAGHVRLLATRGAPATDDDPIRNGSPENLRAFQNVDDHLLR
jgi:uncharacterized protein YcgI (DUF1989 family)